MGRNFFTGNVGSAMEAFRAGKYAEAEKLISEHEAITKTQFGISDMQLRQSQLQLQRERFGQVEQPLAQASIASTEERITSSEQQRELRDFEITEAGLKEQELQRVRQDLADTRVELDRIRGEQGTSRVQEAARLQVAEKDLSIKEKETALPLEERKQEAAVKVVETRAKLLESQAKAFEQASGTDDEETARTILRRAGLSDPEIDVYIAHAWMKESVGALGIKDYTVQVNGLKTKLAELQARPTVEAAQSEATDLGGGNVQTAKDIFANFMSDAQAEGKPLLSNADRNAAMNIIIAQINTLNYLMRQTPIGRIGANIPLKGDEPAGVEKVSGESRAGVAEPGAMTNEELLREVDRILGE